MTKKLVFFIMLAYAVRTEIIYAMKQDSRVRDARPAEILHFKPGPHKNSWSNRSKWAIEAAVKDVGCIARDIGACVGGGAVGALGSILAGEYKNKGISDYSWQRFSEIGQDVLAHWKWIAGVGVATGIMVAVCSKWSTESPFHFRCAYYLPFSQIVKEELNLDLKNSQRKPLTLFSMDSSRSQSFLLQLTLGLIEDYRKEDYIKLESKSDLEFFKNEPLEHWSGHSEVSDGAGAVEILINNGNADSDLKNAGSSYFLNFERNIRTRLPLNVRFFYTGTMPEGKIEEYLPLWITKTYDPAEAAQFWPTLWKACFKRAGLLGGTSQEIVKINRLLRYLNDARPRTSAAISFDEVALFAQRIFSTLQENEANKLAHIKALVSYLDFLRGNYQPLLKDYSQNYGDNCNLDSPDKLWKVLQVAQVVWGNVEQFIDLLAVKVNPFAVKSDDRKSDESKHDKTTRKANEKKIGEVFGVLNDLYCYDPLSADLEDEMELAADFLISCCEINIILKWYS